MEINIKKIQFDRYYIKWILNIWTVITIFILFLDFFSGGKYSSQSTSIGAIYVALLGIYVGQKEFIRWKTNFMSEYIGEIFIGIWTAMMIIFVLVAPFSNNLFRVPTEFAIIYTSVIGIFALTQHSKYLKKHADDPVLPKS